MKSLHLVVLFVVLFLLMFRIVRTFNNIVVVISVATFYDINGVKVSAFVKNLRIMIIFLNMKKRQQKGHWEQRDKRWIMFPASKRAGLFERCKSHSNVLIIKPFFYPLFCTFLFYIFSVCMSVFVLYLCVCVCASIGVCVLACVRVVLTPCRSLMVFERLFNLDSSTDHFSR